MNKIYKVVWSKVRNCYVVVSELAKRNMRNTRSIVTCGKNKGIVAFCTAILCSFGGVAWAADTTPGAGSGVAVGTGSNAPKAENVAIGNHATISYSNGASAATGDVVIGNNARTNNYVSQGGGIAIGAGAFSENMAGTQEEGFNFNQTTFTGSGFLGLQSPFIPADPTKVVTGIAIGQNSYARSGSVMVGTHNYKGDIADTNVDTSSEASMRSHEVSVNATTIGVNSFNNSAFGVVNGAYSAITGAYDGGSFRSNASQNFGATITGSLNSIESKTASSNYSGVGNNIVGVANREFNANGALIFGAGNEITNSVTTVSAPTSSGNSPKALQRTLMGVIKDAEGGGSTMAIGGGNKADYTQKTQITGVNNTVTGTAGNIAKLNYVSGFKNTVTNASNNIVMGNDHAVTANNTIAIGGLSSADTRSVANTTSIGYDAKVNKEGGVALGYKSNATVDKGLVGYDITGADHSGDTTGTWKSTAAAVSVGDTASGITRQITSVAAGTSDTDAVNVAQLKKAVAGAADGNDTLVSGTDGLSLSGNTLSMTVKDTAGNEVKGSVDLSSIAGSADTRNTVTAGENVKIDETPNADGSSTYKINVKADGKVESGNTSIVTGGTVYNETRPTANGAYISKDKSAGENLTALDNQVKTNADSISRMGNSIDKLGNRINRVGAGAAALAALHPQDFDPDDKWDFAAGYGNYKSAHAVAIGAFYRPTEDTMLSVGGSFGGGENMINAGVTFKLGQHNHVSRSRVAIAKEVLALRQDNQELRNEVNELKNMIKQGRTSDIKNVSFPDVPKDHWAYNYVKSLADRGYVTGYPDGEFKGDRSLTRYEYAAVIYRALQNGAPSDADMAKAVNEFGPELEQVQNIERFRVDRISGKDNDRHKVERVRINDKDNKAKNDFRDVYGTSIQNKAH
ncbi:MAG: S-layer homology domain-containing protein [Acidaminococcus fermentans]|uniref:ESPR-type extended signal peptide-containing protein n=1 Tax=Negativicutes TaxID=909932 RepID=UPI00242A7B37|nr:MULTISPECIES: ESPR-type extended signal peptide-containing protein [Negativicutes]MCF0139067.1 S-layer homology domain-containing protein [Acidaminococcus fermentans]MCF0154048.1 S-layer homology domain-containing protein [Megasphaera sp.]